MWGQVCAEPQFPVRQGIIPTRVGTSLYLGIFITSHKDHPHACGDKEKAREEKNYMIGSSPRVWGQEVAGGKTNGKGRIIPTRVGTSRQRL